MRDTEDLRDLLFGIDGAGYGAYKKLRGTTWQLRDGVTLNVERVQPDPYAPPTRIAVTLAPHVTSLPHELLTTPTRRRALADHLSRLAAAQLDTRGSPFRVDAGGQEVLARTTCQVGAARLDEAHSGAVSTARGAATAQLPAGGLRLRLAIALPDKRRRVRGKKVAGYLTEDLPAATGASLTWPAIDPHAARQAVTSVEDAVWLRERLADRGLVAFVAEGAVLPRRSGVDDRPLRGEQVVRFRPPGPLRVEADLPNRGVVAGMGIPEGVTLIVGGGFHGKSTLLRAVERGVYDHVPGDGRELVVTRSDAVKIRAEDGRRVARVDVSPFVGALPTGDPTDDFSTDDASGSTSQAANILEAVEVGARLLLVDEDTSATNLMTRDGRMQQLVTTDAEPLTPLVDLVRPLYRDHGVSTVIVVGGSGDYFDVADHVIQMDSFLPREVTGRAHRIAATRPGRRAATAAFPTVRQRIPDPDSANPRRKGKIKTKTRGTDVVVFGRETIDLSAVEQLVSSSQTDGVASALVRLAEDGYLDGRRTVAGALDRLFADVDADGLDVLRGGYPGDIALPRRFEVAAALNRLRSLAIARLD